MTPLEIANEILEEVNALAPPAVNPIEIFPAHAKILAQEVIRLQQILDEDNVTNLVHQVAKQSEALREAKNIMGFIRHNGPWVSTISFTVKHVPIHELCSDWLAKNGEK